MNNNYLDGFMKSLRFRLFFILKVISGSCSINVLTLLNHFCTAVLLYDHEGAVNIQHPQFIKTCSYLLFHAPRRRNQAQFT